MLLHAILSNALPFSVILILLRRLSCSSRVRLSIPVEAMRETITVTVDGLIKSNEAN